MNNVTSLRYTIMVTGPAYGTQSASCAYQFSESLLSSQHTIDSVFFYADGVYNANLFTDPASDEFDLVRAWRKLAQQHKIKLFVCIAAAQRRGVTSEANNVATEFELVGLGSLSESLANSDRVIQF